MRLSIAAAFALATASSLTAQTTPAMPDLSAYAPIAGEWSYAAAPDGSEATFTNAAGYPQVWVHCTRTTRRVTIARAASTAASSVNVWTSSATRAVPSSFDPTTRRLSIGFEAYDPLLDAIATSRGRIGLGAGAEPTLVLPAWAEIARVVEDCRV